MSMHVVPQALCAVSFAVAALPAQQPDAGTVLDALRASASAQEKAARIVAFTVECTSTIGEDRRRDGELRARVVYETKANGNAHVWFDPRTLWWADHAKFVLDRGEFVHRGSENAAYFTTSGPEGGPGSMPRGTVGNAANQAYGHITDAGADATWWPLQQHRTVRLSAQLRDARADDVRIEGDEVQVKVSTGRAQATIYRFARHGECYSLRERRLVAGTTVITHRVLEEDLVADKVWFPRRVAVERSEGGNTQRTEIVFTDVKLDPVLAEHTFTIVVPAKTFFSDEKTRERFTVSPDLPDLRGMVKLETAATKKPEPPTAPPPEKR